ncbi:histidine kinase [Algoriphagus ratkowskyi]|uniref:Histidine kinase n=1 Tax=Algoriphagus ratkowskyi TaxID=57028 RepID=A0A2W7S1E1_9BACT|nr:histidine kinase [Algoriphagus ratkowskyi]PZX56955.1 histidine kinase [Algoriphagus ratkowskyi]TXD79866.1 histidine kinase [Algoriphagus ratkowskyi]
MKSKRFVFRDIEWWVVTFLFLMIILFNILGSIWGHYSIFKFFESILMPIVLYIAFYLIHLKVIPNYLRDGKVQFLILFSLIIAIIAGFLGALLVAGNHSSIQDFVRFYFNTLALYLGYSITVVMIRSMLLPPKVQDYQFYNGIRLVMIFLFTSLFVIIAQPTAHIGVAIIYSLIIPALLLLVLYNYQLLYKNKQAGNIKAYRWNTWIIVSIISIITIIIAIADNVPEILFFGLGALGLLFFVIFPISNSIFRKFDSYVYKIDSLSSQVNQSTANLSFLRSQINPHFLFNALNTLYGAALMENAEKTSDGIQKLGDMMRFMLHENQMDKIPLTREIDYLRNYLDLQMLRFKNESNLEVEIKLSDEICEGSIAPMLLIPYVENAFKHGISTKSKSWIKINLRCLQGSVHLDVVNSIHPKKQTEDPRDESGIGLENVKSRLAHFYPQKHNLTIVANDTEHFVHLSVQLT